MDMVNPRYPDRISQSDLKRSKQSHVFFNTFLNITKYLEFEQRDPFDDDVDSPDGEDFTPFVPKLKASDWDRWAAAEYENLVLEEQQSISSDEKLLNST